VAATLSFAQVSLAETFFYVLRGERSDLREGNAMISPKPPSLADMTARYLEAQVSARAAGLGVTDETGEVVPHEPVPVQPIDPRLAWKEALAVLSTFRPDIETADSPAPPAWAAVVGGQEPAFALALCVGNFPQLVRHLQPLIQSPSLAGLRPGTSPSGVLPAQTGDRAGVSRVSGSPQALVALALLRLERKFEHAAEALQRHRETDAGEWQAALANEQAALAWHRGQVDEAERLWQAQPSSPAVLFNRGMAALFGDRPAEARPLLAKAVAQLPHDSGWHHLAALYLALAEIRLAGAAS
jgi:hypothetical protein